MLTYVQSSDDEVRTSMEVEYKPATKTVDLIPSREFITILTVPSMAVFRIGKECMEPSETAPLVKCTSLVD
jgi:hypothetical protein